MAEEEWVDEPEAPPKKRGIPGWLLFCGGGCLIAFVLSVIGGFLVYGWWQEASDPEIQWPRFDEYVEVDEPPAEWSIARIPFVPGTEDSFILTDQSYTETQGTVVQFFVYRESSRGMAEPYFDPDFEGVGIPKLGKVENPEPGEVRVQGRTLRIVRFTQSHFFDALDDAQGAYLDVTPEGDSRLFLMQILTQKKEPPVTEEFLESFLAPFHIGPDR